MSSSATRLCFLILKERYGEVVASVACCLAKKNYCPLRMLSQDSGLKLDQVKKALCTLIQHNLVTFQQNKKGFIEYVIHAEKVLQQTRFPRYIYCAKTLYGDPAELIIEELLQHGQMTLEKVVQRTIDRLTEAMEGKQNVSSTLVKEKFVNLVQTHFVQRCTSPDGNAENKEVASMPVLSVSPEELYVVPKLELDGFESRKRKRSGEGSEAASKRIKTDESESSESSIFWRVNVSRFHQYLRDQAIVQAVASKIDKNAAEVVRAMLRLSEVKTDEGALVASAVTVTEVFQNLPREFGISKQTIEQYMKLLSEDSSEFVSKVSDSGGGMYVINFKKLITVLCRAHIESAVQERFGSKCFRIFRLLLMKKNLEQKQIEEYAMIPSKEAKELLYRMFEEKFVSLTEVPKTPDHAPSRTFYLFSVNINQVSRMLLERCYQVCGNLIIRREHETKENR
ncbi:DNA-directed RNA polymerase III subunit RPC3-like [Lingula anatina]|uniref:DNA-directed RNA polymerase III subunit RPC3 n=1 Tax=Lingula anatina TaxID=7574 RepID=A0A2R2MSV9_LINAN|nr:DNA-directed RNA polymerase III subunit RPC3-like [Lingula anatina]|eukprot:XP_023933102.1 DNA-directed RNA polymerase III subunit RPC3-like [Lingula anatina]